MFGWFKKIEPVVRAVMSDADKNTIRFFAEGDNSLREEAIKIYRKYMPILGSYGCGYPEMDFMSEVDNPVPDWSLRSDYRKRLLEQENATISTT